MAAAARFAAGVNNRRHLLLLTIHFLNSIKMQPARCHMPPATHMLLLARTRVTAPSLPKRSVAGGDRCLLQLFERPCARELPENGARYNAALQDSRRAYSFTLDAHLHASQPLRVRCNCSGQLSHLLPQTIINIARRRSRAHDTACGGRNRRSAHSRGSSSSGRFEADANFLDVC